MYIKGNKEVLQQYADDLQAYCKAQSKYYISPRYTNVEEIQGEYYCVYMPEWVSQPEGTEIVDVLPINEIE